MRRPGDAPRPASGRHLFSNGKRAPQSRRSPEWRGPGRARRKNPHQPLYLKSTDSRYNRRMQRLSPETQTLYAELSERLRAFEAARSFASLAGAFAKKRVRGGDYWYFKTSAGPAGQREYFVGPDNRETRAVMDAYAARRAEAEQAVEQMERLCAMLRPGGAQITDTPSARGIAGLASAGGS